MDVWGAEISSIENEIIDEIGKKNTPCPSQMLSTSTQNVFSSGRLIQSTVSLMRKHVNVSHHEKLNELGISRNLTT